MLKPAEKPLMDLTYEELTAALANHTKGGNMAFSYNDVRLEIERREQKKHNDRTFYWSMAAVLISAISLLASVLVAIFK